MVVSNRSIYAFVFLCTKSGSTYFRRIIKVYTSDRHVTVSEDHTVVIWKMRSAGLYSTALYCLYFEQNIDGYIINRCISSINKRFSGIFSEIHNNLIPNVDNVPKQSIPS